MIEKKALALNAWLLANHHGFSGYQIEIYLMGVFGTFQLDIYNLKTRKGYLYRTNRESLEQVLDDAIEYLHIQVPDEG